jgi:molybdopterin converting factor small subunit
MPITVRIPTSLRRFTGGKAEASAQGRTVAQVIDDLERNYPGLRDSLLDSQGVRRFVNLYVGEDDIRFLNGLDTELAAGNVLTILPGIAGG